MAENIFILTLTMFVIFVARTFVNPCRYSLELGVGSSRRHFGRDLLLQVDFRSVISAPIWGYCGQIRSKAMILRALLMTISMMLMFVNNVYQLLAIDFYLVVLAALRQQ